MDNNIILDVKNLNVDFISEGKSYNVLKNISFELPKGRVLGIVGESGCGKSVTVNSIMNLLPSNFKISSGEINFNNDGSTVKLNELQQYGPEFRKLRGSKISMIFQDPMSSLNPVYTIGEQIMEVLLEHTDMKKEEAKEKAIDMLRKLGIKEPEKRVNDYPHQFSGGMRQRVLIAIAMICKPDILIADEPTTALDVTIQAEILDLIKELQREMNTAVIIITHDLGVIAQIADDVAVMYGGEIVEKSTAKEIFENPMHPYTRSLLNSIPSQDKIGKKLHVIDGMVPSVKELANYGCRFSPRISWIPDSAHEKEPQMHEVKEGHFVRCTCYKDFYFADDKNIEEENVVSKDLDEVVFKVQNLKKYYPAKRNFFGKVVSEVRALDDVSFNLPKGKTVGIVGESGCGKSTLAKALMKLHNITDGNIIMNIDDKEEDIFKFKGSKELKYRKKVQMVFQDPYSSLNPMKKIYELFDEPMRVHKMGNKEERYKLMLECLDMVNLPEEYLYRYPHEFSGGQRQRICIAKALCLKPEVLILDEPVSALDLSVQAQVLNYLMEIQEKNHLSYILISHDLGVVKYMCDYIYVINKGRFVEAGTREDIYDDARHIYTRKLLSAIPEIDINTTNSLKAKRDEIEKIYDEEAKKFYDEHDRVYDLKNISSTHLLSIK